jgi:Family of unknown function (DUF6152)
MCGNERMEVYKMKATVLCGLAMVLGLAAVPAVAHHSFAAEYDSAKPISLTGTVTKVEWMNPHARFYLDVKDEGGKVTNWEFELGSPNGLMRRGWTRNSLKEGDTVTVAGSLAKDGSKLANARTVKLSDGKEVFAGSASETGDAKAGQ